MDTFFADIFINSKELNHLTKEIRKRQLSKTIDEIEHLNKIQNNIIQRQSLGTVQYIRKQLSEKKV